MATSVVYGNAGFNGATIADQTTVTNGNAGTTQVNNLSGSVVKWVATTEFDGAYAVECVNAAGQAANGRWPFGESSGQVTITKDFKCPVLPAAGSPLTVMSLRAGSTVVVLVQILNTGIIDVKINGTSQAAPTSQSNGTPTVLVAGSKYRLELYVDNAALAATAALGFRYYAYGAAASDYIGKVAVASAAVGTAAFTHSDLGLGSNPSSYTDRQSNLRMLTGVAAFQGPYVATTPSLVGTCNYSPLSGPPGTVVTATGSYTGGVGTARLYSWAWGDGATTTAQSSNTATHTYTTEGSFSPQFTVAEA